MANLPSCHMNNSETLQIAMHFSVDDTGFFEGPEKLLEVWFQLPPQNVDDTEIRCSIESIEHDSVGVVKGLRVIPRYDHREILITARAK